MASESSGDDTSVLSMDWNLDESRKDSREWSQKEIQKEAQAEGPRILDSISLWPSYVSLAVRLDTDETRTATLSVTIADMRIRGKNIFPVSSNSSAMLAGSNGKSEGSLISMLGEIHDSTSQRFIFGISAIIVNRIVQWYREEKERLKKERPN